MPFNPVSKDVTYRIQNFGYAAFLELPVVDDDEVVSLRPLKDVAKQQWKFVANPNDSTFTIRSADNSQLQLVASSSGVAAQQTTQPSAWTVSDVSGNPGVYLISTNRTTLQYNASNDSVDVVKVKKGQEQDEQMWRILEVTSSVNALVPISVILDTSSSYRIRSINGGVVLDLSKEPNSNNAVKAKRLDVTNDYQRWKVNAKGNDKYEITNVGKYNANNNSDTPNGFLSSIDINGDSGLRGGSAFEWKVRSVGVAYALTVKSPRHDDVFAVSIAEYQGDDSNKVVLAAAETVALDHLWLLEPWKSVYGATPFYGIPYPVFPYSPDRPAQIFRTLPSPPPPAGNYKIQSASNPDWWMAANSAGWYPYNPQSTVVVTLTPSSDLTFTMKTNQGTIVVQAGGGPSRFALNKQPNGSYICGADAGYQTQTVLIASQYGNYVTYGAYTGDAIQRWNFIPA